MRVPAGELNREGRVARALVVAGLLATTATLTPGQTMAVLRIAVSLTDAGGTRVPVPRHALLVSDEPPTASPRRVVTAADGTASLRLPPGRYLVESDQPLAFQGRSYVWRQSLDVSASAEARIELTSDNAEVEVGTAPADGPVRPTDVIVAWQDSVVALWTPTRHASGAVIDARGLVVTSWQAIGDATAIEVQLTAAIKVRGHVLTTDRVNDVAVLRVDAAALGAIRPVPAVCGRPPRTPLANGQEVVALGTPINRGTDVFEGPIARVTSRTMIADLRLRPGSVGGPVFGPGGDLVGLTSLTEAKESAEPDDARVVRVDVVCEVLAKADTALAATPAPDATRLPVEPARAIPVDTLRAEAEKRIGSLTPPQVTSESFEVSLVTPVSAYGLRTSMDFANWAEYVADTPSVLLVRVTPKREEGFWAKVARGLVMTQGVALPPIKRFVSGFARLRALCGTAEVTPIHPFLLERRISASDAIHEGLYVFDPGAFGPHCGTATFELFSDKAPATADRAVVPAPVLEQVWRDFAAFRALK